MGEIKMADQQYLTFSIADDRYALPVGEVREVLEPQRTTKIPRTAPYIKGIINVRGTGLPIIDLRLLLDLPERESTMDTAVIVVEYDQNGAMRTVGLVSDAVHEVIFLDPDELDQAPKMGTRLTMDCIRGIGRHEDDFVLLLDLGVLLGEEQIATAIHGTSAAQ
jgi:purine-binding chemotaxis protein CheW